jgi:hypothetical protein
VSNKGGNERGNKGDAKREPSREKSNDKGKTLRIKKRNGRNRKIA